MENDIFWSVIGSGFGEPGGTLHREFLGVPPPPGYRGCHKDNAILGQFCVQAGAHNKERTTAINSCNGVFTSKSIFR